jgi:hypothetical protein
MPEFSPAEHPSSDSSPFEHLARAALLEITPASTVGAFVASVPDAGDVSLTFENTMPGYPGWLWTVSVAQVEGEEPTVLEVELMPAHGALLAPDWLPWSDRLAEYKAAQAAAGLPVEEIEEESNEDVLYEEDLDDDLGDDDLGDDDLDDDELDEDDVLGSDVLHGGDLDGVDLDLDDADDDADDDAEDDAEDD